MSHSCWMSSRSCSFVSALAIVGKDMVQLVPNRIHSRLEMLHNWPALFVGIFALLVYSLGLFFSGFDIFNRTSKVMIQDTESFELGPGEKIISPPVTFGWFGFFVFVYGDRFILNKLPPNAQRRAIRDFRMIPYDSNKLAYLNGSKGNGRSPRVLSG
jgi:hypothetical protein